MENSIGARIRWFRESMDYSRDTFATILNISKMTLARYETDERKPDADFIIKFCEEYDVSADWLLFGKTEDEKREFSVDELLLISLCRRHPDEVIHHLRALLMSVSLGESEKDSPKP